VNLLKDHQSNRTSVRYLTAALFCTLEEAAARGGCRGAAAHFLYKCKHIYYHRRYDYQMPLNEDAVAWSFVMVVLALLVLAGLWIVMTPFAGYFVDLMNERIAAGTVSAQTADAFEFNVTIFTYWPAFALGALFLFSIIRALYERRVNPYD